MAIGNAPLGTVTAVLFALAFYTGMAPERARAQDPCRIPETGHWINPSARTQQIRRIEIESDCKSGQLVARMRAFTKCAPRDCKWGWTEVYRTSNGRLFARFAGFFGSREIQVIPMGNRIEALVTIDPHDPKEPDAFHAAILSRE
ncbi:hypothetical protein [Stappia sp. ES.058]|uniref:hypothetical protein n=1 Tax=Stappia sp. ES.058 TaxID=1881061 RepID=UPI00087D8B55|nr:hypothetical protein [Stappia sp. ES.058]SDU47129.1 hypothetical protein SAMN05428979_4147 [Stappia sp. ES.058]